MTARLLHTLNLFMQVADGPIAVADAVAYSAAFFILLINLLSSWLFLGVLMTCWRCWWC